MKSPVASALILVALLDAAPVPAQATRDPALAEQLFHSAQACLTRDDWVCACEKFSASMEADPSVSTLFNIARCHEHDGKLTLAWAALQEARKLNRTMAYPDEGRRAKLADYGDRALEALERRVPKLRIMIAARPEGLQIRRNGSVVPLGALGESIRVDPGTHAIVAEAPGYTAERRAVELAEGQVEELTLTLAKPAPATPPPGPPPAAPPAASAPKAASAPPSNAWRTAGWVGVSVGGAGLATAGILGIVTMLKASSADASEACKSPADNIRISVCNSLRDAARGFQTAGIVTAVLAGATAGVGVVLLATAPRRREAGVAAARWSLVAHPTGVSLIGRY